MAIRKRVLFVGVAVGVIVVALGIAAYFLFVERAREYSRTEFHTHTALSPVPDNRDSWHYGKRINHVTFVLTRGRPHSTVSSGHGWWEMLSIEFPGMPGAGRVDLAEADVTMGFTSYRYRTHWTIGQEGVRGYLEIISVTAKRIDIKYRIVVNAFNWEGEFLPEYLNEERVFEGRSTFE